MKGIILAEESRPIQLYPLTRRVPKELLPVFDKPMIYYPLSTLMLAGIRDIIIIGSNRNIPLLRDVLDNGSQWGLRLQYLAVSQTDTSESILTAEELTEGEPVAVIHGDQIFYGRDLVDLLQSFSNIEHGAAMFAYSVRSPSRYAVVELDPEDRPLSLEDRPSHPRSDYAVPGLYFYDHSIFQKIRQKNISLVEVNQAYLREGSLKVVILGRGIAWLDAGTPETLLQTATFIQVIEERQGFMIACPEEIAYRNGFIDSSQLKHLAREAGAESYGDYLHQLLEEPL